MGRRAGRRVQPTLLLGRRELAACASRYCQSRLCARRSRRKIDMRRMIFTLNVLLSNIEGVSRKKRVCLQ
ncbi:hypothetical protein KCP76_25910 [Salmonella enterica subsp. enterica serovar Weltevreden]|nr:hypothetical protein KCP76_25910 [Salmonella enterica subsp. enterica serovar Weltevreden]